ncbi:hypothetical protein STSP_05470 [Streptomyces jeddahensis]|uniref:Uncharacterized protein n=1 Tax=Streptomyces jeddahensis TaxID=1716141 RepID=A0A177I0D2_9ACTN|nr:hypothetical protein STSP_05470 [Streptomyces jeddahensis]
MTDETFLDHVADHLAALRHTGQTGIREQKRAVRGCHMTEMFTSRFLQDYPLSSH